MTYVRVKIPGFKTFKDRHGKWRCYHRASNAKVDLEKYPFGSTSFIAECERINAMAAKGDVAKPGTLGLLIARYRAHSAFTDLKQRTRVDYLRCADYLRPVADTPLTRFTTPLVVKIRDTAAENHGRRFGNYVRTFLSLLFQWGRERGYIATNPAASIKAIRKPRDAPYANRPWADDEREAVLEAIPAHMRLPIVLMMFCGLDPQDALNLPRTAISDGKINTQRGKTGMPVWYTLPQPVVDALADAPQHGAITLCANSHGRPWDKSGSGFRASWGKIRSALESEGKVRPGLTLKGLRHTVATILSEMGYDDRTVADMLGQKTTEMAQYYSRRADTARKLDAVVKSFDVEVNIRRTKIVKPS